MSEHRFETTQLNKTDATAVLPFSTMTNIEDSRQAWQQHSDSSKQSVGSQFLPAVDLFDSAITSDTAFFRTDSLQQQTEASSQATVNVDDRDRVTSMERDGQPIYSVSYDGDQVSRIAFPRTESRGADGTVYTQSESILRDRNGQYELYNEGSFSSANSGGLSSSVEPLRDLTFNQQTGDLSWTRTSGEINNISSDGIRSGLGGGISVERTTGGVSSEAAFEDRR